MLRHSLLLAAFLFLHTTFAQRLPNLIPFTNGVKWGYADTAGKVRIPPRWDEARLFNDGQAVVYNQTGPPEQRTFAYALINESGQYIISPEAGWNGRWQGWAATPLNVRDSNGRWGLVDREGRLLLPFRWSGPGAPLNDSLRIVVLDGRQGVINRRGDWVIPPIWGGISATDAAMASAGLLAVRDPDASDDFTQNNTGLIDLSGRMVLPTVFASFSIERRIGDQLLLAAQSRNHLHPAYGGYDAEMQRTRWFLYPSGRELSSPPAEAPVMPETVTLHGYRIFGRQGAYGLESSRGKVLLPRGQLQRFNDDTLWTLRTERGRGDSLFQISSLLSAWTLQPLAPPVMKLVYSKLPVIHYDGPGEGYTPPEIRISVGEGDYNNGFYKDSLLLRITGYATDDPADKLYIVRGDPPPVDESYYSGCYTAVIDSNLNYVVPPQKDMLIRRYNRYDEIVIGQGSTRYNTGGYALFDRNGRRLTRFINDEMVDGFRWRGAVYAIAGTPARSYRESPPGYRQGTSVHVGARLVLVDSTGAKVPALAAYMIDAQPAAMRSAWRGYSSGSEPIPPARYADTGKNLLVRDTAGRVALLRPDGSSPWPALAFRYGALQRVSPDWFLATAIPASGTRSQPRLLKADSGPVSGKLTIHWVEPLAVSETGFGRPGSDAVLVPGLYQVRGNRPGSDKEIWCLLDEHGRLYFEPEN